MKRGRLVPRKPGEEKPSEAELRIRLMPMVSSVVPSMKTAAKALHEGVAALCGPTRKEAEQSCKELSAHPELLEFIKNRICRYGLADLATFTAAAHHKDALQFSRHPDYILVSQWVRALGEERVSTIIKGLYVHHRMLAGEHRRYAYLLIRISPHWLESRPVRRQLIQGLQAIHDGEENAAEFHLLAEPIKPSGSVKLKTRGAPTTMMRDSFLADAAGEKLTKGDVEQLIAEATILFGPDDRDPESVKRSIRKMRATGLHGPPPKIFLETRIGERLAGLVPGDPHLVPAVVSKLASSRT